MNGKLFAIATLFAVILLTVAFIPITSQQASTYDPWADYNGDGKIDITDVANSAIRFGTTGDPTRNVTITGHATKVIEAAMGIVVAGHWDSGYILVDGYSKVTVLISITTSLSGYTLWACVNSTGSWIRLVQVDSASNFNQYVKTYDVMSQAIWVHIDNNAGPGTYYLWVVIYLMA